MCMFYCLQQVEWLRRLVFLGIYKQTPPSLQPKNCVCKEILMQHKLIFFFP